MPNLCAVSHPRSGTHWILKTIYDNLKSPYGWYFEIFATHHLDISLVRKTRPNAKILNLSRDIQPVLMSVFRMRERNGISIEFDDFSEFLRTKYKDMPRTDKKTTEILWHGRPKQEKAVSWIGNQDFTPPDLWLASNKYWGEHADHTVTYEQMQENENDIIQIAQHITGWARKGEVSHKDTVGWKPKNNDPFPVLQEDQIYLDSFRQEFIKWKEATNE